MEALGWWLFILTAAITLKPARFGEWLAEVVEAFENYFEEDEDGEGD